ncbi:MAG TPA: hypothetical protein VFG45_00490 [Candidatus Nitrosocosmicus sp.]|uniref:hypothetical protein n=1 Tax=Candidatus Nitrosocosmicus agrestis TaxID=2563600 RepID=UPI00122DEB34|nr:hypothetical protein [Candidatus Nitrosocosmicus sp. SS]KAA2280666.1 hypothetical protein F1Z66_10275 [Candidatus Nitrosocosmicus sp. SS]KAF0869351.1 hypothetical protein E5N71_05640 [Candidatus Nitrosocosmicus sp. SS]HET6588622.1 hypothetical protein [Candidatus Nitrosocosmicus sp.]
MTKNRIIIRIGVIISLNITGLEVIVFMNSKFFLKFGIGFCLLTFVFLTSNYSDISFAQLSGILGGHVISIENYQFQNAQGCSASIQLADTPPSTVVFLSSDNEVCNNLLTAFQNNNVVVSEVSFLLSPPPSQNGNWNVPVFVAFSATLDG